MVKRGPQTGARLAPALVLALALAAPLAAGCAGRAEPPPPVPVTVKVPVPEPVFCPATAPARPALPIASLSEDSSPADTMRAYAASVVILKGAVRQRDEILAGCTREPGSASFSGTAGRSRASARAASSR
jgi:hypothetical protein